MLGDRALPVIRDDFDLTQIGSIPGFLDDLGTSTVINCAAYTDVEGAEDDEEVATTVNGRAVGAMAGWAASRGGRLLTFSTDYVFDGLASSPYTETSPTGPINAYGRSKRAGEVAALGLPGVVVVRTSWLMSGTHPNFVATVIRAARNGPMQVVQDQVGCPSVAADVAGASWQVLERGAAGLIHVTNGGSASRYELARQALTEAGLDPELVAPCSSDQFPTRARRPAYSVMRSEWLDAFGVIELPHWSRSLRAVVAQICSQD